MPQEVGNGSHNLITTDAGDIYDATLLSLESALGEPLWPGDERRYFAEALVALLMSVYNSVEDAAHQKSLRYARGEVLDALGERLGVTRLGGTPATCTLRFTASETRPTPIKIPKWTKATSDSEVYFATDHDAAIAPGELTVDVPATATGAGAVGNGYPPGSVTTLVDLIAYIDKVTNTDESAGGDDGELYTTEGDDRFRERIRIAVGKLSVAGPEQAYIYWAMTADARISDVAAVSETETYERECDVIDEKVYIGGDLLVPTAGLTVDGKDEGFTYTYKNSLLTITITDEETKVKPKVKVRVVHKMDGRVRIVPLLEGGEIPDEDTLAKVLAACNARDVRPMTDLVTVEAPVTDEYDIELTYYTTPEAEAAVMEVVEGAGGAIERYNADQCSVLGRDINPDMLQTYIMRPFWGDNLVGATRVDIVKPEHTEVEAGHVAKFSGTLNVKHKLETEMRWSQ